MHLLYLDDAGSTANKNEEYLVLGGVSIFEAQAHFITEQLDKIAAEIDSTNPSGIEFHASEIFARRTHPWNKMTREEAQGIIKAVLKILAGSFDTARAFACAIHKTTYVVPGDMMQYAFEDLCQRFDLYLSNMQANGDRQRGLLILDESSHETSLQQLSIDFRKIGTKWGNIKHLADVPFFCNSKASRIIQLADHVAYAVFRRYNAADAQYFDIIAHKFHASNGIVHGLAHKHRSINPCMCPSCMSRRIVSESIF